MKSKMTTNSQLSTTEPKKQEQTKWTTRIGTVTEMDIAVYQWESRREDNGRKGTGNKKHKWQVQNRQREVKNSIGNGEAKELLCTTRGHELRWGNAGRGGVQDRGE